MTKSTTIKKKRKKEKRKKLPVKIFNVNEIIFYFIHSNNKHSKYKKLVGNQPKISKIRIHLLMNEKSAKLMNYS